MLLLRAGKCSVPGSLQRLLGGAGWSSVKWISNAQAAGYSASPDEPSGSSPPEAEVEALNRELDGLFGTEHVGSVSQQEPSGAPPGLPGPHRPIPAHQPPRSPVLARHEELEYDALQRSQQQQHVPQPLSDVHKQEVEPSPAEPPLHALPLKVAPSPVAPGHVASSGLPASHIYNRRKIDLGGAEFEARRARGAAATTSEAPEVAQSDRISRRSTLPRRQAARSERSSNGSNGSNGSINSNVSYGSNGRGAVGGRLSHVNASGKAVMVDVADKASTVRDALASCRVLLGAEAFAQVEANKLAKGDVLTVAQLAGVMGAKQTSALIPLCHNIPLSKVDVRLKLDAPRHSVIITASARSVGPTGVEMEALTAAAVAALTVYDMCKAVSKDAVISELMLQRKSGGKSGTFQRLGTGIDPDDI